MWWCRLHQQQEQHHLPGIHHPTHPLYQRHHRQQQGGRGNVCIYSTTFCAHRLPAQKRQQQQQQRQQAGAARLL